MIDQAQTEARALGFKKMILSTAEIQRSAVSFIERADFGKSAPRLPMP